MEHLIYDVEFSYTSGEQEHLMMAATQVTVDHEVKTSDDLRKIAAEIGRQNGYTSCRVVGVAPHVEPETELEPFDASVLDGDDDE